MRAKLLIAAIAVVLALLLLRELRPRPSLPDPRLPPTTASEVVDPPDSGVAEAPALRVTPPAPAPTASIDPEHRLDISVVTTRGAPIADAAIEVVHAGARQLPGLVESSTQLDRLIAQARTNVEGQCSVELAPNRIYDVLAQAPGFARVASRGIYAGEALRIVLPRGVSLHGDVIDGAAGTPVAGARLRVRPEVVIGLAEDEFAGETDAKGHFEIAGLPAGSVQVDVSASGYPSLSQRLTNLREGESRETRLALGTGVVVRGRVTDGATKLPIHGATVSHLGRDPHPAITDEEGRYVIHGIPRGGDTKLTARASGYGDYQVVVRRGAPSEIEQDLFLLPGRVARGRVVDSKGAPVPNAHLVASGSAYVQGVSQFEQRFARSDTEGRFQLLGLRVDLRHTLLVHAEGLATAVRDFPEGEWASMELELGDVVLLAPATLAGHVRDPDGKAVTGRWVLLDGEPRDRDAWGPAASGGLGYKSGEGFGFGRILARTDGRGRYRFDDLPAGRYHLWAGDKGFEQGAQLDLELQEGEQVLDVDLELDSEPSIRGVVVDTTGSPLGNVTVQAMIDVGGGPRIPGTYAITAPDGTFALCGLRATNYDLECRPFAFDDADRLASSATQDVTPPAKGLRITMFPAARTRVVVVGPDDRPVQGAVWLRLTDPGNEEWQILGSTDADGAFELFLAEGPPERLRVAAPNGPHRGAYVPVLDANGKFDGSYEIEVGDLRAGSSDRVIRFARLP